MDGIYRSPLNRIMKICLAACSFACTATLALAQPSAVVIPIEKMTVGTAPAEFDFARTGQGAAGQWVVLDDPTALNKRAIEQSSTDRTDYRFPLAIYQSVTARNVEVTIRFKSIAGKEDQSGGIAVRLTSPDDYYIARANALEDNVRFYRVVKGRRQQLSSANVKVPFGEWHTLALKAENDRFTVSFNGKTVHSSTDRTLSGAGRVALWTKSDSVTRFEQISIRVLP